MGVTDTMNADASHATVTEMEDLSDNCMGKPPVESSEENALTGDGLSLPASKSSLSIAEVPG